jgi:hypothetical protein
VLGPEGYDEDSEPEHGMSARHEEVDPGSTVHVRQVNLRGKRPRAIDRRWTPRRLRFVGMRLRTFRALDLAGTPGLNR